MKNSFLKFPTNAIFSDNISFHSSFSHVEKQVQNWLTRFKYPFDQSFAQDFNLFYLLASKNFLDHRNPSLISRLFLSIHLMQKNLAQKVAFSHEELHVKIRWLPGILTFPFSKRAILGCLVGYNALAQVQRPSEENADEV